MRAAAFAPEVSRLLGVRVGRMFTPAGRSRRWPARWPACSSRRRSSSRPTNFDAVLVFGFTAAVLGGLESPPGALVGGAAARARAELRVRLRGRRARHARRARDPRRGPDGAAATGLFARAAEVAAVSERTLPRHLAIAARRRRRAVRAQPARSSQFDNLQLATMALLVRRRRRADRADRPQRADLARARRADGGRRLHGGEAARGRRAPARRSRVVLRRRDGRGRGRGVLAGAAAARLRGPVPGGRDARARRRAARDRAALPGLPRRRRTGSPSPRRSPPAGARRDVPARALAGVDRVPRRRCSPTSCSRTSCAAGSGATSAPCATTRSPPSSPGCTSRARRCSRSSSAPRAPGSPAGCSSSSRRSPRPGAFPLALSVALLTGVDPRRARQPRRRGLGRRRARADPHLGRRRQPGARRCPPTCRRTSRSPSTAPS